jgi:hypothetical protein
MNSVARTLSNMEIRYIAWSAIWLQWKMIRCKSLWKIQLGKLHTKESSGVECTASKWVLKDNSYIHTQLNFDFFISKFQ